MHAVDGENYNRTEYTGAGTNPRGSAYYGTDGNNYAVFAEGDINFTKEFRGILGARFVHDDLDYHMQRNAPVTGIGIGANFASQGTTEANDYTDRIGLQYDIADGLMSYFTYSHGYKGPAFNVFFNMSAVNTAPLKPETSDAYEIGLKANLYHHKLEANVSAFIDDFDNYQANFASIINGGLVTNLINAGTVSTKGVAADLTARPTDALTLNAGMAATIARVDHFACPPNAPVSCDIDGKPLPFAPDWKMNIRADYDIPLGDSYALTLSSDYSWQSATQYQLSEVGDTIQPAYGIWNGGITLNNDADGWQVIGQVKNILDQHYLSYIVHGDLGGVVGWIPRDYSRYYGISFHKDF
jgi:iron complex outermembrane receptor protein